jgi:hypothetical protein
MLITNIPHFPAMSASVVFVQPRLKVQSMRYYKCQSSVAVLNLRTVFLEKPFCTVPKLQDKMVQLTSVEFLKAMIYERTTLVLVGKFVYEVLQEFYAVPLPRPRRVTNV